MASDGSSDLSSTHVQMADGSWHPLVGFGTYKVGVVPASASAFGSPTRAVQEVIKDALEAGYRCFDCAQFYANEAKIGEALAQSSVPRDQLFLISKVWNDKIYEGEAAVRAQVEQSLKDLQTDYLDMYLVHWPVPGKHVAAYKALLALKKEGKLRHVGVSNYTIEDYKELMAEVSEKPAVNQIEVNPWVFRQKTLDFFRQEGVLIQSYRTLGQGKQLDNATLLALAEKHSRTPAQVLGRWTVQQGIVYLPKSEKKERMRENRLVTDFTLDDDDMARLAALGSAKHVAEMESLYRFCVIRDTPLTKEDVRQTFTIE
eukprot:m.40584 g.40584  ORF g.40584 m.40584 type:complete len:315 (+) comp11904_c0_seq1:38-982(+)